MRYKVDTSLEYLSRYFNKFFKKEVYTWIKVIRFYRVSLLFFFIITFSLFAYFKPLPPKKTILAIGSEGSSYASLSDSYQETFKSQGLSLELVPTNGLGEGLNMLNSSQSPVDASFLTAGVYTGKDFPGLVSLGSIQYAPLWIFYRGAAVQPNDPFDYFSNKKIYFSYKTVAWTPKWMYL